MQKENDVSQKYIKLLVKSPEKQKRAVFERKFAFVPKRMRDGKWIFFKHYYKRLY